MKGLVTLDFIEYNDNAQPVRFGGRIISKHRIPELEGE